MTPQKTALLSFPLLITAYLGCTNKTEYDTSEHFVADSEDTGDS